MKDEPGDYGSIGWFINEYAKVDDDPWGLGWRPSQQVRYAGILRLLDIIETPPCSILDIGCATGDFTHLLKSKYGQNSSVTGIDFIEDAVDRAKQKYPQFHFRVGSIFSVGEEYKGQMDLVTCLEVLYYLERKECSRALSSVRESLRPGGYAVFSSLISSHPYFSLNELKGLVSSEFSLVRAETVHVRLISLGEKIIVKLEKLGKENMGLFRDKNIARRILRMIPFQAAEFIEKCSRHVGGFSASHALVMGRRV